MEEYNFNDVECTLEGGGYIPESMRFIDPSTPNEKSYLFLGRESENRYVFSDKSQGGTLTITRIQDDPIYDIFEVGKRYYLDFGDHPISGYYP